MKYQCKFSKQALVLLVLLFIFVRTVGLGTDISNTDAARWHRRSLHFLQALKSLDLDRTYQHYQPGVTLMWLAAPTEQVGFWFQLASGEEPKTLENADWYPVIDGLQRFVLVLVLGALFYVQLSCVRNLFSGRNAIIFGLLVLAEPYLIGIDRWFHVTSLEAYFGFTSVLVLLYALNNQKKLSDKNINKLVIFSALLFIFSFLAKITAIILLPLLGFILYKFNSKKSLILYISVLCIFTPLLFPALLVNATYVLDEIWGSIYGGVIDNVRTEKLVANPLFFYPMILAFKLSPVTLILGLLAFFNIKKLVTKNKTLIFVFLYFCTYFVILTLAGQKIDRYLIPLFLPLILIISVFVSNLEKKYIKLIFLSVALVFIHTLYFYSPVFSAYYSPAFGGTKSAIQNNVYDNSGEYFAQAAFYLNTLGRNNNTYIPNNYESFSYYYKGNSQRTLNLDTNFIVTSLDFDRKSISETMLPYCTELVKSFGPKNYAVVYIYKCENIQIKPVLSTDN